VWSSRIRPIRAAQRRSRVDLTQEQVEAAEACGCALLPATEAQIALLSMQRRVFRIDGSPFVATRDGGSFFETRGTLTLLIEGHGHTAAARSGLHASGKKAVGPIGMEAHLRRTRCRSGGCGSFPLRGLWAGRTASPR
jgi:hypothetical protein